MNFATLKQEILDDWAALAKWRIEAREDFAFYAGDQWTDEERAALKAAGRAAVSFNRTAPIIDSVVGSEINNRTEVRFIPREMGDAAVNEMLTGAAQWFLDESDADEEDSAAFQDAIISGIGVTLNRLDTDEDPAGQPSVQHIDPLDGFGWDRNASRKNLRDARRFFWGRKMSLAEAKELFPGKTKEQLHAAWFPNTDNAHRDVDEPGDQHRSAEPSNPPAKDEVVIVHVQWRERQKYFIADDPTQPGQRVDLSEDELGMVRKVMPQVQAVEAKRWRYREAFIGADFLDGVIDAPNQAGFDFQVITGKRDRNERRWFGVMRAMKEPQRWANKWLVQMLHIMNSNAKGGIVAEAGVTDDPAGFEQDWAKPDSVHWVKDGALQSQRILPKPQAQFPQGFQALTEFAVDSIPDVTGVNMEMLGLRDANQAGVLEYQRRQSALTILAPLFDGLRAYRHRRGRLLLYYIQNYLSDGRLIKIAGEGGEQYVPLIRDGQSLKYDVIVDDAPTSPNQKEMTWQFLQQILPMFAERMGPEEMQLMLEYSPLPESFVAKLRNLAKRPDPAAEAQQQMAAMEQQAEIAKTQSETEENKSQVVRNQIAAQRDAIEAQIAMVQPYRETPGSAQPAR